MQLRQEACYSHVVTTLASLYGVAASNSDSVASQPASSRQAARRQLLQVQPLNSINQLHLASTMAGCGRSRRSFTAVP